MTANVSFIIRRKADALLLPASAVKDAPGGVKQVVVKGATEDEPPTGRDIKTGIETGEMVEIVDGLREGDEVFVSRKRYVPQQQAAQSPLMMGGRPSGPNGQAPGKKRQGGGQ
jgi:multidrug efflux pump subunit AcrA (membrane-fusion protein)